MTRPLTDAERALFNPDFSPRGQYPIPSSGIQDAPAKSISINEAWLPHLIGALDVLDQPDAWSGTDIEIDNARAEIRKLLAAL